MRFYGNVQYALECIALKQITFLHIDKLNDPFDPYYNCRITDNIKDDFVFEMTRHFPKAEIFKARMAEGKFALDFEQIAGPANAKLTENRKQKTENRKPAC